MREGVTKVRPEAPLVRDEPQVGRLSHVDARVIRRIVRKARILVPGLEHLPPNRVISAKVLGDHLHEGIFDLSVCQRCNEQRVKKWDVGDV